VKSLSAISSFSHTEYCEKVVSIFAPLNVTFCLTHQKPVKQTAYEN